MPSTENGRACKGGSSEGELGTLHDKSLQMGQGKLQGIEMRWVPGQEEPEPGKTEAKSHRMGAFIMTHN